MTTRAELLRRAGFSAVALSPLIAAADAASASAAAAFAPHPRWRFSFVHSDTTDPLHVATQFGIEDACDLLGADFEWTGSARGSIDELETALRKALDDKADGIALVQLDSKALDADVETAKRRGIPVIAFSVGAPGRGLPYIGADARVAGALAAATLARHTGRARVAVVGPEHPGPTVTERSEAAVETLLGRSRRRR